VHVLHERRQCSLHALCMLSIYPTCVPTRYLLTPRGQGRKGSGFLAGYSGGMVLGSLGCKYRYWGFVLQVDTFTGERYSPCQIKRHKIKGASTCP
jgi:hypothetical protein